MKTAFIFHGSYGNPEENWFPWLKKELEEMGFKVYVPQFPTPKGQNLENWTNVFEEYEKYADGNTIFIGHSMGATFILNLLENRKARAAFLVSGFLGSLNNKEFDDLSRSFVEREFDWTKIKKNCKKFFVFHSDNDPYVPVEKAKELKKKLSAKLIIIKDAGHFNEKAGYKKFQRLLEEIEKV
jgi:predicted alpha/beta hydrolase family esterase